MSKALTSDTPKTISPNRVFAAILLKYGLNPKGMWKRNGVYGCGNSGFRFYPNDYTMSITRWETHYVGGSYEREMVDRFFQVSVDEISGSISWRETLEIA